jgi:hypothetical protein
VRKRPLDHHPNYALILLLFSLLAYSAIGLTLTVSPAQAETLAVSQEPSWERLVRHADVLLVSSTLSMTP